MNKKLALIIAAVAALAQLGVVACMIQNQEIILREGKAFRFRTAPVDPYDAFRGRYVALALEPRETAWPEARGNLDRGDSVYVTLGVDSNGFAEVTGSFVERPATGDYLRVEIGWSQGGDQMRMVYPADRYYLPEDEAPRAEELYRKHSQVGKQDAYAVLKIRNGEAAVEDLMIGGKSIREWLKESL